MDHAAFFTVSLVLLWYFGWRAFADDAQQHGQAAEMAIYLNEMLRDTFENWQSEFLQLLWQVVGLAYFLYVGSPSSKENDDRMEVKIDAIVRAIGKEKADALIAEIDHEYERHSGPTPHGHQSAVSKHAGRDLANGLRT